MHKLSIDLETYSSVDIKECGSYKYTQSPDFEILLFGYSLDGFGVNVIDLASGEQIPEWLISALRDPDYTKCAYNAAFEIACLSRVYGALDLTQWKCTMIHSMYCGYPGSLAAAGAALGMPEDKQKANTGKALIRYFCNPCNPTKTNGGRTRNYPHHDPEKWQLFKEYNAQDVVAEMAIDAELTDIPVPDDVWAQWRTDLTMNMRGAKVDMDFVDGALSIIDQHTNKLMMEAQTITKLDNPNSNPQLLGWLQQTIRYDAPDNIRKDTVAKLLDNENLPRKVHRVLELRQELGKTSNKKYKAVVSCVCADQRVRGLTQFYGANRTGRYAGRLVQVQNLPRTYITNLDLARDLVRQRKAEALEVIYGPVQDTLSQLIRTMFIPSDGNMMLDADFSAIEARVIACLAGERWRLDVFNGHGKIYEASASQMFGVPIELIKKGNPEYALRAKGKVAELALGYQGSSGALIQMGALDMGLSEDELPDIVTRWRDANPAITALWRHVENCAHAVLAGLGPQTIYINEWNHQAESWENNGACIVFQREYDGKGRSYLTIRLPSGRKLYYCNPRTGENRFGGVSIIYTGVNQTTKKWEEIETYGGKLVENITQAVARDCLADALERLQAAGYPVVFHVHDEVVIDAPPRSGMTPEEQLQDVIRLMSIRPAWLPSLPLTADGWVGRYFKKE